MKPFWQDEPLTAEQSELLSLVLSAHHESVFRDNISSQVVKMAAYGSGSYVSAIAAALMTLGGIHAPLIDTYQLLTDEDPVRLAVGIMDQGGKVPGWGTSFQSGPDPLWAKVDSYLHSKFANMGLVIDKITNMIHAYSRVVYPNPSCYTAATAIVIGLSAELSPWLFIQGRLAGWSQLCLK